MTYDRPDGDGDGEDELRLIQVDARLPGAAG